MADCYQVRADLVASLETALAGAPAAVLGQVLSGMGGVGKTQAAAAYARRRWETRTVDALVWITAASRDAIITGYAHAGDELHVSGSDEPERAASQFLSWLASTPRRWLIVLDDLANPAHLRGLWPPLNPHGQVLVTTRRRDAALCGHGRVVIDVGLFTPEQAVRYLTHKLAPDGPDNQPPAEASELANDLGRLPLALAQAAAYIRDRADEGMDCPRYRLQLADQRRRLAESLPESDSLPDDHRDTVAASLTLSVQHADQLRPKGLARPVLELASVLDPNGIPAAVLTTPATLAYLSQRTNRPIDGHQSTDALSALRRLNLTSRTTGPDPLIRVHALVQRAIRDQLPPEHLDRLTRTAADALIELWPPVENPPTIGQVLRANTATLRRCNEAALLNPDAHEVLYQAGRSLGETGQVTAAIHHFQQLHNTVHHSLGADDPHTLSTRHNLARWRFEAGDLTGAVAAFQQLLDDYMRVLGADHPHTLAARHNLAYMRGEAGDVTGAVAAIQQVLDDDMRVLGADHPHTLGVRGDLAYLRGAAGDPAGAAVALQQLLDDCLRVLGADHPCTLVTRYNLARCWGEAGDPAGAVAALERLLDDRLRVLGADHPDTLATRRDLARWWGEAGDPAGAVAALERLLDDCLRVLGAGHSNTLTTRNSLAYWQGQARR